MSVIGILWRKDLSTQKALSAQRDKMEKEMKEEIDRQKEIIKDLSKRISRLEDERLSMAREHGSDLRNLTLQIAHVLGENRVALSQVARALREFGCMAPHDAKPPCTESKISTESLAHDDKNAING